MILLAVAAAAVGTATLLWATSREKTRRGRAVTSVAVAGCAAVLAVTFATSATSFDTRSERAATGSENARLRSAAVASVEGSAVGVSARGCGQLARGSGFVVRAGVVATNAHVVAGADTITVATLHDDPAVAAVVYFDPVVDLALLSAPGLAADPVAVGDAVVGDSVAVVGYPTETGLEVDAATVEERIVAIGSDIFGASEVRREVLLLDGRLSPGLSGSPVVDAAGNVVGMAFAVDADDPGTAYALVIDDISAAVARAPDDAVATGPCLHS